MPGPSAGTKVLMSFGAVDGGFEFAMQLRLDIYRKFGKSPDADGSFCYLDAESLRGAPGTGYKYNAVTDKNMMENKDWETLYNAAMASCRTIILLITRQWLTSKYCWMELDTLVGMAERKQPMTTVIVLWPDAKGLLEQNSWQQRQDKATRSPGDFWKRIKSLKGGHVYAVSGANPIIGAVGAQVEPNKYAYSCSASERDIILAKVVA